MTRRATTLLLVALLVAEATAAFETAMIYAAMAKIIKAFGDPVKAGWLVTSYLLIATAATAVVGRIGDIYGRKLVMIGLLAAAVIGSVMSALASDFGLLLAGRSIQGFAGAILPLCFGIVRAHVRPERVPLGAGIMVSGATIGTAAGLVLGGLIVDRIGWHSIFIASAVLAFASLLLVASFVPRDTAAKVREPVDLIGGLLFVPAITGFLLYVSNGKTMGWATLPQLAMLGGSLVLFAGWVRQSLASPHPLIDIRLFSDRTIFVANLITALFALSALQITLVFSVLLQAPVWTGIGLGVSATVAGLVKLPSNVASIGAGPLSGWLTGRLGGRVVLFWGGLVTAAGWFLALFFNQSTVIVGAVLIVISFGTTMAYATAPNLVLATAPLNRSSEATGMLTVVRTAFMAIGAQLIAVVLATDMVVSGDQTFPSRAATLLTIGMIGAVSLGAALLAFALPKPKVI
ncbi:MAG: MFS transporter [Polymorphobacter sp.]